MRKLIISCLAACLALGASAASAQNRPNQPPNGRGRGMQQQYRQVVLGWAGQYMPNLHQLALGRNGYFGEAANHYRIFMSAHDDETRERLKGSYTKEDQIFGYVLELRQAVDTDQPAIREKIYNATLDLVNGLLKERAQHIATLQHQIAEQEKKLEDDRENIDQLVQTRINSHFLKDNPPPASRPANDAPSNSSPAPSNGGALTSPQQNP